MNRRNFLAALVAAPAIVRSESLMRIWVPPERAVITLDSLRNISRSLLKNAVPGPYMLFVHPDREADIRKWLGGVPDNIVFYQREILFPEADKQLRI